MLGDSLVECLPLTDALDRHQAPRDFDLLNVDVEGLEIEVLESLDFHRYRPKVVISEVVGCHCLEDALAAPVVQIMKQRGYTPLCRLDFSVLFYDRAASR